MALLEGIYKKESDGAKTQRASMATTAQAGARAECNAGRYAPTAARGVAEPFTECIA